MTRLPCSLEHEVCSSSVWSEACGLTGIISCPGLGLDVFITPSVWQNGYEDILLSVHMNTTRSEYAMLSGPPPLHCIVAMPVGEPSIVTAVSAHQMETFVACKHLLEQVKLDVPIWKEVVHESSEPRWKGNRPSPNRGKVTPGGGKEDLDRVFPPTHFIRSDAVYFHFAKSKRVRCQKHASCE